VLKYIDGCGISFDGYRQHLPLSVHDWPNPRRVKSPKLLGALRLLKRWELCWRCLAFETRGRSGSHAGCLHHIIGGTKGRSDERTNLMPLCTACHMAYHDGGDVRITKGQLLWAKWLIDRKGTSWVRLALLNSQYLPDLEPARGRKQCRKKRNTGSG